MIYCNLLLFTLICKKLTAKSGSMLLYTPGHRQWYQANKVFYNSFVHFTDPDNFVEKLNIPLNTIFNIEEKIHTHSKHSSSSECISCLILIMTGIQIIRLFKKYYGISPKQYALRFQRESANKASVSALPPQTHNA